VTPALVFGKYEIQHRLAVGGMGEVFYALERGGLERPVILKALLPELAEQKDFVDQFLDEARLAATLNHPNVVSLFEVGQSSGTYFLAMEFIRGRNLSQLMRKAIENGGSVPRAVAVRIIRDAAQGLDHAHCATDVRGRPLNIVHRDVSPQNIMVREDGVAKLLDFGIARAANRTTRTATGVLKGKLAYMAPEQLLSAYVGPRTDQYALGIVLWELLCNRGLFRATTEADLMKKVIEAQIPRPSSIAHVDAALEAVLMRMLERESSRRFDSCADVSKALDRLITTETGAVESPGEFMRRLGTADLVVGPKLDSKDFIIDLKATPHEPRKRSDDVTTPVASRRAPSKVPVVSSAPAVTPRGNLHPKVHTELKGHGFMASHAALVRLSGPEIGERVLNGCPTLGSMMRKGVLVSSGWYPIELYAEYSRAVRVELGPDISVKLGREATINDVNSIFRFVLRAFSPQVLSHMLPRVFATYCRGAKANIEAATTNEVLLRFSDFTGCTQGLFEEFVSGAATFVELGRGTNTRFKILEGGKDGDSFVYFSVAWD
jgi:serine/threonine protein kinase